MRQQDGQRRKNREDVFGELGLRKAEKYCGDNCPAGDEESRGRAPRAVAKNAASVESGADEKSGPRQESQQNDWAEKPKRLTMLKDGREVTLEVVLDDEDAEEAGVGARAKYVPRECEDGEG